MRENPVGVKVKALSPENRFSITVGPATDGFMESYCGGHMATQIKGCGIDAVVVEGKADKLSYLKIDENGVSFCDASDLQGKDAYETEGPDRIPPSPIHPKWVLQA